MTVLVAACNQKPSQAEAQAVEVVKLIVSEPDNTSKLDTLSHGRAASIVEEIQNDLPSKIAVEFMQARQQQGIPTHFEASTQKNDNPLEKHIVVSVIQGKSFPSKNIQAHFLVLMQKEFNQDWSVTGISLHAHTSDLDGRPNESNNKEHSRFTSLPPSTPDHPKP